MSVIFSPTQNKLFRYNNICRNVCLKTPCISRFNVYQEHPNLWNLHKTKSLSNCVRKKNSLKKYLRKECSYNSFRSKITPIVNCPDDVGLRKFNIIHAQLCMNCSNLIAHLHSLHVIDSPACVCSHSEEDTAHFFLDCPLYYVHRLALRNTVLRFSHFGLEMLLYGDDNLDYKTNVAIVLAVHELVKFQKDFNCVSYVIYSVPLFT